MAEQVDHRDIIAVCERVQTEWFRARAEHLGGRVWSDRSLTWVDGPDGLNLMFPHAIESDALSRSIDQARAEERELVGAWLSNETDATALASAGFERGWAPWWMFANLDDIDSTADPRVHVGVNAEDFHDEKSHEGYDRLLRLAQAEPDRAFYAGVRVDGVLAGHAWAYVDNDVAGIFDLDVWPPFRRRGLGAALLHGVAGAARDAGAKTAVLSTSPQGAIVYRAQHFNRVGMGATWFLHL
jgi:GNAT superfamily N-acetyltransferase